MTRLNHSAVQNTVINQWVIYISAFDIMEIIERAHALCLSVYGRNPALVALPGSALFLESWEALRTLPLALGTGFRRASAIGVRVSDN